MIREELYDSLKAIFDPSDSGVVNIYEQNNPIVYGNDTNTSLTTDIPLITFLENPAQIKGKGDKYIEQVSEDPLEYKYFYSTRYWIDVIINFYGDEDVAENMAIRLNELLNNNEDNFIDQGLGILNYGTIQNLTELENAEFKERFAISIKVDYTKINESSEESYLVKQTEFELDNKL